MWMDDAAHAGQLAYVIYTSGSTGQPKGVLIEHRNTMAMLQWAREAYSDAELRSVLASTSLNFDLSVYELMLPLCFGFRCVVVRNALSLSEHAVDVSLINTVPSAMKALLDAAAVPASVRVINLAGEALTAQQVNQLLAQLEGVAVCNLYGPSEDTTYSTYARFTERLTTVPSIGRVIANSQSYVLGSGGELLPVGAVGELYLGGAGLARGYLNRPELTAERFVANPYYVAGSPNSSERLYRTGDLVRYRADGALEFIGRIDDQVKVRGFRIELGEIEHRLNDHIGVQSSLVMAYKNAVGEQQLVAYVQGPLTDETSWGAELQAWLRQTLPEHMVPAVLIEVQEWPLNANGKVDRKALPAVTVQASGGYQAPAGATEQLLAGIWSEVLGIPLAHISATASFFELGGHSLYLLKLTNAVAVEFQAELSLRELYDTPSLAALSELIDRKRAQQYLAAAKANTAVISSGTL